MYIIVGLGNPGKEYEGTRHNVGREVLVRLATAGGFEVGEWKFNKGAEAEVVDFEYQGEKGKLVAPETYMNLSGKSVMKFVKSSKQAEQLVVVHDDFDLPIGTIRISFDRGAGGHKGVESIATTLKTKAFIRLRIGVAAVTPSGKIKKVGGEKEVHDFVLGKFKPKEQEVITEVYAKAMEALMVVIRDGREVAANRFNTK